MSILLSCPMRLFSALRDRGCYRRTSSDAIDAIVQQPTLVSCGFGMEGENQDTKQEEVGSWKCSHFRGLYLIDIPGIWLY
jgi:hypothetical protein